MAVTAAACLLGFGLLTVLVATGWPPVLASDLSIDTAIHAMATSSPALVGLAIVLSYTGGPALVTAISTIAVVVLAVRGRLGFAVYLATTALGGVVLSEVTKGAVERARPVWPDPLWGAEGASYPSGHSMAGITNCGLRRDRTDAATGVAAVGRRCRTGDVGLLMAPSRLVLGVHWPADVVAGWLLGAAWVLTVSVVAVMLVTRQEVTRARLSDDVASELPAMRSTACSASRQPGPVSSSSSCCAVCLSTSPLTRTPTNRLGPAASRGATTDLTAV
jgi:undecaprenyl-diphosphatase